MPYSKPYLSVADQLALIEGRGMVITDRPKATEMLNRIGYYRLSGYWYPFRESTSAAGITTVGDNFRAGTELGTVIDLYVFDKKLRLLMLDAFERIEIALRVQISLALGLRGPRAHRDPYALRGNFARQKNAKTSRIEHQEWLRRTDEKLAESREEFAKHFRAKYAGEHPPIWIACETWDYGAMSYLFSGMQHAEQTAISNQYGLSFDILESWIRAINLTRNVCAHHGRLWNKPVPNQPKWPLPASLPDLAHIASDTKALTRVYGTAVLSRHLLRHTSPATSWPQRLKALCATFPVSPHINLAGSGFPTGWDTQAFWT